MEKGKEYIEILSEFNNGQTQKRIRNASIQNQKILKFNREKLIKNSIYYNIGTKNLTSIKSNKRNFLHNKNYQSNPNSGLNSLTSPCNSYFMQFINPNQSGLHSTSTVELNYHSTNRGSSRNAKFEDEMKRNGLLSDICEIQSMNTIIEKDIHKNKGRNDSDISEYVVQNISPRYGSSSQKALNNDLSLMKKIYFSYQRNHRELSPEKILKKQSKKIGTAPLRINREIITSNNYNLNRAISIEASNYLLDFDRMHTEKKNNSKGKLNLNSRLSKRIRINLSKNKETTPDKIPCVYLKSFSELSKYWKNTFSQDVQKIDLSQVKYTNNLLTHPEVL